jgi:N-formylglutamate amidohydrolase
VSIEAGEVHTANDTSCDLTLAQTLLTIGQSAPGYQAVLNGSFKGGYINRNTVAWPTVYMPCNWK